MMKPRPKRRAWKAWYSPEAACQFTTDHRVADAWRHYGMKVYRLRRVEIRLAPAKRKAKR